MKKELSLQSRRKHFESASSGRDSGLMWTWTAIWRWFGGSGDESLWVKMQQEGARAERVWSRHAWWYACHASTYRSGRECLIPLKSFRYQFVPHFFYVTYSDWPINWLQSTLHTPLHLEKYQMEDLPWALVGHQPTIQFIRSVYTPSTLPATFPWPNRPDKLVS